MKIKFKMKNTNKRNYTLDALTVKELREALKDYKDNDIVVYDDIHTALPIRECEKMVYCTTRTKPQRGEVNITTDLGFDASECRGEVYNRNILENDYDFVRDCIKLTSERFRYKG